MKIICKDRLRKLKGSAPEARGVSSVSADVDRLLSPKSYEELEALEKQIRRKLDSNEPIDVDYWEHLLRSLIVWKAKAKLRRVSQAIISSRLQGLRKQQQEEALSVQEKLQTILHESSSWVEKQGDNVSAEHSKAGQWSHTPQLDPEPLLKLRPEDKTLDSLNETAFLEKIVSIAA